MEVLTKALKAILKAPFYGLVSFALIGELSILDWLKQYSWGQKQWRGKWNAVDCTSIAIVNDVTQMTSAIDHFEGYFT